jgi:hypothetical protein
MGIPILLEARVEQETFVVSEEEFERYRMCGKTFKPNEIKAYGEDLDSTMF